VKNGVFFNWETKGSILITYVFILRSAVAYRVLTASIVVLTNVMLRDVARASCVDKLTILLPLAAAVNG